MARGAKARGKRIAFGDGKSIIFSPWSADVFRNNPNVAWPGDEGAADVEWIAHYKGHRLYNRLGTGRWFWNESFRAQPGEIFFDAAELAAAERVGSDFVLIEPNVPAHKSVAPNKQWPVHRYQRVADQLRKAGHRVVQLYYRGARYQLSQVEHVATAQFRDALAVLSRARLYIGPEGGLHHGAAALGRPAVVIFGGFIPPAVTGYDTHVNLAAGGPACGSLRRCRHCRTALHAIGSDVVLNNAMEILRAEPV